MAETLGLLIAAGATRAEFHENGALKSVELSGSGEERVRADAEEAEPENVVKKAALRLMNRRGA